MSLRYEDSGVNYDVLDAFKRACQRYAATTTDALASHQLREPPGVRGESAYLVETPNEYLAHVEEGLGTKNLVADAMLRRQVPSYPLFRCACPSWDNTPRRQGGAIIFYGAEPHMFERWVAEHPNLPLRKETRQQAFINIA